MQDTNGKMMQPPKKLHRMWGCKRNSSSNLSAIFWWVYRNTQFLVKPSKTRTASRLPLSSWHDPRPMAVGRPSLRNRCRGRSTNWRLSQPAAIPALLLLMVQKSCEPVEVGSLSNYLQDSIHSRWLFGISAINSITSSLSIAGGGFNLNENSSSNWILSINNWWNQHPVSGSTVSSLALVIFLGLGRFFIKIPVARSSQPQDIAQPSKANLAVDVVADRASGWCKKYIRHLLSPLSCWVLSYHCFDEFIWIIWIPLPGVFYTSKSATLHVWDVSVMIWVHWIWGLCHLLPTQTVILFMVAELLRIIHLWKVMA